MWWKKALCFEGKVPLPRELGCAVSVRTSTAESEGGKLNDFVLEIGFCCSLMEMKALAVAAPVHLLRSSVVCVCVCARARACVYVCV